MSSKENAPRPELTQQASYYTFRTLADGETVARTIEIVPSEVMLDVDADGRVLGCEVLGEHNWFSVMGRILDASRWAVK